MLQHTPVFQFFVFQLNQKRQELVLDFGADKTATAGTFTIAFPAADSSNAIIRIA